MNRPVIMRFGSLAAFCYLCLLVFGLNGFAARKSQAPEASGKRRTVAPAPPVTGRTRVHKNLGATTAEPVNVLTMSNDPGRTGRNLNERVLNTSTVKVDGFGRLFTRQVDGAIFGQPLVVSGLSIPGRRPANVVYVTTEHNSVYAFDGDNPARSEPVWHVNLGAPVPNTDITYDYHDLAPEIGITGTPVIDPVTQTIYVVAKTKNPSDESYHQTLHALDIRTGSEKFGGPVEIQAAVKGVSPDARDGVVWFDALRELNRAGLLLANGVVYIAFGSHADHGPYHGWLLGYDARTLKQVAVLNTSPDGGMAGIWQAGQAPASDSADYIYAVTGNGTFSANRPGGRDFGECLLKLSTRQGLEVAGWYSPANALEMDKYDVDLGAGGPLLIPGTSIVAVAGKDGLLRILDKDQLAQHEGHPDPTAMEFRATNRYLGTPVYWDSPVHGPLLYMWGEGDRLKALRISKGIVEESPVLFGSEFTPVGLSNTAPLSLSAHGSVAGSGIIWAACPVGGDANWQATPGILRAFDASVSRGSSGTAGKIMRGTTMDCSPDSARLQLPMQKCTWRRLLANWLCSVS